MSRESARIDHERRERLNPTDHERRPGGNVGES